MASARSGWPLLGKELVEQAARRQTYILRVLYAGLLFGVFGYYLMRFFQLGFDPRQALGAGGQFFHRLMSLQSISIFLFLPPLMAGAIAHEKERDTLTLLFLTDLTPWQLIMQKYVSRLIPMFTFLFTSLPLLAIAYALGGVAYEQLLLGIVILFLTCLQVGAFTLMCSAYSGTTFQALLRTYLLGAAFYFFTASIMFPLAAWRLAGYGLRMMSVMQISLIAASVYVFLRRAKHHLLARATVPSHHPVQLQFRGFNYFAREFQRILHQLWLGSVRRAGAADGHDRVRLMNALAKLPVPAILSVPAIIGWVLVIILFAGGAVEDPHASLLRVLLYAWWITALLSVPVMNINAIAAERMNQRLDILLSTPLTGAEILRQLLGPAQSWRRYLLILVAPLVALEFWQRWRYGNDGLAVATAYLGATVLVLFAYLPVLGWFSVWIGLKVRTQLRAMMIVFGVIAGWCYALHWLDALGPLGLLERIETARVSYVWELAFINLAFHGGIAGGLWWLCRRRADRYLGRL